MSQMSNCDSGLVSRLLPTCFALAFLLVIGCSMHATSYSARGAMEKWAGLHARELSALVLKCNWGVVDRTPLLPMDWQGMFLTSCSVWLAMMTLRMLSDGKRRKRGQQAAVRAPAAQKGERLLRRIWATPGASKPICLSVPIKCTVVMRVISPPSACMHTCSYLPACLPH